MKIFFWLVGLLVGCSIGGKTNFCYGRPVKIVKKWSGVFCASIEIDVRANCRLYIYLSWFVRVIVFDSGESICRLVTHPCSNLLYPLIRVESVSYEFFVHND